MSNPNLGNELDAALKPGWLAVVHGIEALVAHGADQVKANLAAEQTALATALTTASTTVSAAQAKVDTTVNPIVNNAIHAAASAITTAYPPFGPLVAAAEPEVEALADGGTDAILIALIGKAASLLSSAGKSVAAVNLSNLAGAV